MTTTPQRFTKRPVTIEAIQWDGTPKTLDTLIDWSRANTLPGGIIPIPNADQDNRLIIHTLEGTMRGDVGDWVIKGVSGEFYACKPDIFTQTYDPAAEHMEGERPARTNADVSRISAEPSDAEVQAAAEEAERHEQWCYDENGFPHCECGASLVESEHTRSVVPPLMAHQARAALVAAREASGR